MFTAELIDKNKVLNHLQELPKEPFSVKNRIANQGLRKGVQVLLRNTKKSYNQNLKKKTGNLYKSLVYKVKKRKLGALMGQDKGRGNHLHLLDLGTKDRYTKRGYYRGKGKSTYFYTKAVMASENEVKNTITETIDKAITKQLIKGSK